MTHAPALHRLNGRDIPTGLLIGGRWRGADDAATMTVIDPATGQPLADVASATVADAAAAVDAAAVAMPSWTATAPRVRGEVLRRAFELMVDREEWFAELIVSENGKSFPDALGEVRYAAEFFRWYSEEAVRLQGSVQIAPSGDKRMLVIPQPIGVALLITPWNFPAAMATRKIGPALAAGCSVILKPASDTPLTALAVADLLSEAGVPDGVVNVIPSRRSGPVAAAILADPRVRKLSFTGSTEVGRTLLAEAARYVVSTSMELGGNAPFIVLDDADIDEAVAGAMIAKMRNGGEACTAANRIYVHESVAAEFGTKLTRAMASLTVGSGSDRNADLGPLVNETTRTKVHSLVAAALDEGAEVLTGAAIPPGPGFFYPPTVLAKVAPTSQILREEIFGPVAPIVTFSTDQEAIELANDTEYGLVAYLFTRDLARGLRVSEALESGMVGLNRGVVSDPAAPFGGAKQSGLGREGGHDGMLEYVEPKYIAVSW